MSDPYWMDFSGAPPIIVPHRWLPLWRGFYLPCEDEVDEESLGGDLELPDGRAFYVVDEFDFENPVTDYDRVCAYTMPIERQPVCVMPLPPGELLAFSDYSDGRVGWWDEERMLLTVSRHVPDLERIPDDGWTRGVEWTIPDGPLRLMNACEFGTAPAPEYHIDIELEPGRYRVDWYDYTIDYCVMVYRLRPV